MVSLMVMLPICPAMENHATVHGPVLGIDRHGQPNNAYIFDGVDDYISLNQNLSISGNQPRSLSTPWKPSSIPTINIMLH